MEIEIKEGVALTAEQVTELAERVRLADELKSKNDQLESEKAGLVEEIKVERTKKQEAADLARAALEANDPDAKILSVVEKRLEQEKTKQIETSRAQFEDKFKSSNPEFQPSNDPAGIKFEAFKKILTRFNLSGLTTETEFADAYKDAMLLLKREEGTPANQSINRNSFSPSTKSSTATETDTSELSAQEQKLIASINWTKEKYLKLKASQPHFVTDLLSKVRD
jgi:hypothetical protein